MAQYYNHLQQQIDFLINNLNITPQSKGVDLACGKGEQLLEIQKVAPNTAGVDIEKNDNISNFIQLDLINQKLEMTNLDFAYCLTPYFGEEWWKIEKFVENVACILQAGGLFCFDLNNFNSFKIGKKIMAFKQGENEISLTSITREIDRVSGQRIFVDKNWNKKTIDIIWRIFNEQEVAQIFLKYGLKLKKQFSGFEGNTDVKWEPNLDEKRIVLIFEKL